MFWFVLLLLIVGTGFYLNSSARDAERDIINQSEKPYVPEKVEPAEQSAAVEELTNAAIGQAEVDPLEGRILEIVAGRPGMKQTDLYPQLGEVSKKALQQAIKALADGGRLKREKNGSSYLLFP